MNRQPSERRGEKSAAKINKRTGFMEEKKYLQDFVWKEMKSKILRYPIFGEVIYGSLADICELLERTQKSYQLVAYVRKTEDGIDENVVHFQMHFKDVDERDTMWTRTSEEMVKNIKEGIQKATDPEEKLEIENILCAVRSD